MPTIEIDGHSCSVPAGTTLLEAARGIGIWIPTLCYHEALTPYGGCRLCVVEMIHNGQPRIVPSCSTEAVDGSVVRTDTEQINEIRAFLVELLLAEAPDAPAVQQLARDLGVSAPKWMPPRNERCISCGLCIRACREIVGIGAIGFARRGYERTAASPFFKRSDDCIGCGTCAAICPTDAITLIDIPAAETGTMPDGTTITGPARILENWKTGLTIKQCKTCGQPFAPQEQLDFITRQTGLAADFFDTCVNCRK